MMEPLVIPTTEEYDAFTYRNYDRQDYAREKGVKIGCRRRQIIWGGELIERAEYYFIDPVDEKLLDFWRS